MWARVTVIIVNLWVGIPFTMLQVTGILMNIPKELYEAAQMDGAGPITIFFKITMPYILFVTTPYLITSFIGNINNFNVIYLLTGGAPASLAYNNGTAGKTDLLVTWLYKLTMDYQNYNYAAVISILVFILSATFSLLALKRSKVLDNEEAFQ
jgi:arabinogalactan oligomer/maltooligosaccharide transport system permease protein